MLLITLYLTLLFHLFFLFTDTTTSELYTLSLHDALPISRVRATTDGVEAGRRQRRPEGVGRAVAARVEETEPARVLDLDRKSTRLNSSHMSISYAVFCLKKKKHIPTSTNKTTNEIITIIY